MLKPQWFLLLLIPPFVKGCVYPGWSSALELALCCGLVAFLTYFLKPGRDEDGEKFRDIHAKLHLLTEQIATLRLKLGFRPER
jgi:hypothetical protein